jgi:hypothetical protein
MSRAFGLRLVLSVLALGCTVSAALTGCGIIPGSYFPVHLVQIRGARYRVEPLNGQPLPAGLRAGDVIALGQLRPAMRVLLLRNRDVPRGTSIQIPIERSGRPQQATLRGRADILPLGTQAEYLIFLAVMLAITLLTLWRGRNWAAWSLTALFFAALVKKGLIELPAPLPWLFVLHQARALISFLIMFPALFILADTLAGASLQPRHRRTARGVFAALIALTVTVFELRDLSLMLSGSPGSFPAVRGLKLALFFGAFGLTLLVLIIGYRRATHQDRLRIGWVLWSSALAAGTDVALAILNTTQHPYIYQALAIAQGLSLLGFLYAVLRTRLIDAGFVIDRALVFGLLTALVFGTFSILEDTLHQFAVSDKLGWALQALAALILAVVLSPLHRRLESWIEQIFFRSQRLALLALERLACECPFVERETHLLAMTVERLQAHCAAAAIYTRAGGSYRRSAAYGGSWPETVDADDPVFVTLRATHETAPLAKDSSTLGAEGFALPMNVAQSLLGALVCRPREGEQFAPEIRAALANVAHHLGMAIVGLRHREHARLVADVAAGRVDTDTARRRAIMLLNEELPLADAVR